MNKLKTKTVAYEGSFLRLHNTGWGCGYVIIPKNHPILIKRLINIYDGCNFYLQPDGFSDEITYCEEQQDSDNKYTGDFKIGFDTAHSWNNSSHDEAWVLEKTEELKICVNNYTEADAKSEAEKQILSTINSFKNYL
tara:strand:- start:1635 stop:2045 length:411 start_codon:yes stop_codon:yes gene_type:complete